MAFFFFEGSFDTQKLAVWQFFSRRRIFDTQFWQSGSFSFGGLVNVKFLRLMG